MFTIGHCLKASDIYHRLPHLLLLLTVGAMGGCTTTYYHNETPSPFQAAAGTALPHKDTYNEGLVTLFSKDNSVDIETLCGQQEWETIKTEANFMDVVIKAIANPIWGTYTVEFQCESDQIADITSPPNLYSEQSPLSN